MHTNMQRGEGTEMKFQIRVQESNRNHKTGVVREDMVEQQHQVLGILLHSLRQLPLH